MRNLLTSTFLGFAGLAIALGLSLSCGSSKPTQEQDDADGIERISVWQGFTMEETAVMREIMADFEKDYAARTGKKIRVDVQYVSFGDMFTKLRTAALARMTPDIAFMDSIKVTDLALGRALTPIDELESFKKRYASIDEAREQFVAASFNAGIVNRIGTSHLYALPVQTTTVALFWNRDIFRQKAEALRKAGLDPNRPPRDWDEMEAYGKVITDTSKPLYAYGMSGSLWFNFPMFNMYRAEFVNYAEDGTASTGINSSRGEAVLARIQRIRNSGVEGGAWQRSALGPEAGFINRMYAMILTGPWMVENFTNAGLDFDISMIPGPTMEEVKRLQLPPRLPGGDPEHPSTYSSSNVGGQSGVILRLCENKELAYELLEYFTSEPVQRRWASQLGQIPVRKAAWENLDTSKFPFMPMFMKQLSTADRIPQIPLYGILENDVYNPQIDLLLNNGQTPADMLKRMETGMNTKIFGKMNDALKSLRDAE